MKTFRWGIFGTGAISAKFVAGLSSARSAEASFICSRSIEKAERFAAALRIDRAIQGYAAGAMAGGVDAIYIATPPSEHVKHATLCIEAGIPVLIEKPIASSAAEARQIANLAKSKSVFAMEAMWTRFLPAAQALRNRVEARGIGEARLVAGNFGISQKPEIASAIFNPELGGGCLAHLGVYPLSLTQWLFGSPILVQAMGTLGTTGVDEDAAFQLRYPGGVMGSFFVSIRAWAPDEFQVLGPDGMLALRGSIVRPYGLDISSQPPLHVEQQAFGWRSRIRQSALIHKVAQLAGRSSRAQKTSHAYRYSGNGYHYEADEVRNCLLRGAGESTVMPLSDSISVASTTETIRDEICKQNFSSADSIC